MRLCGLWLAVVIAGVSPALAAPAIPVDGASSVVLDLSDKVEWCESGTDQDVVAIGGGGCHFTAATAGVLARGFSQKAFWLRFDLVNPGAQPVERWLRIGHPRLDHVSFFEATKDGAWRQSDTGMRTPPARRPVFSADPILPLVLAPGESRTILVRVVSRTSIDLTPSLWPVDAYLSAHDRTAILQAFGVAALLVTGLFTLMIYWQWKDAAYLYFSASELSKAVFVASYSGLLPTYLWPETLPFDIRIQAVAAGCASIFFVFFVRHFIGGLDRYRCHHFFLLTLAGVSFLATGWTCLIDYSFGMRIVVSAVAGIMIGAIALFWRAWRAKFRPAGFLLASYAIFLGSHIYTLGISFGGGSYNDVLSTGYLWGFLLSAPIGLFGIAVHKEQLQKRLQASQAESAARVEFLAHMSHELRTPLDAILGTAQLLSRPGGPSQLKERLGDIRNSGWHLLKMIDDILDHARGMAGKLAIAPHPVDWPIFLRGLTHNAQVLAARNGNLFSLRASGTALRGVLLDERRLRQILDNLLVNAARHTKDGWIRLDCAVGETKADGTLIIDFAVTDSGEGIPEADQERIFLPFQRGSLTANQGGKGVGMGLAISRQLVEMMGGHLTVESRPGKGARFRFQIAARPIDNAGIAPITAEQSVFGGYGGPRRTILLVDDEEENRRILAALLAECGFIVRQADGGRAAVALSDGPTPIDLVLTDQFMTDGDGWMVLRVMRERHPDAQVVLISAAPPDRPADFPEGLNFIAHILKPLDHAKLLRLIGDLLGLEWTDAGASDDTVRDKPLPAYCRPDLSELEDLRRMIENGQVSGIMAWSDALATRQSRCADFAEAVHQAARQADFQALAALTE
jgi:signal transduction histidine kinase/CheY-like chemotaxis protein